MDLALSETQQMLKTSARDVLGRECPLSLVRKLEEDPKGHPDELWRRMSELGWLGLVFPEEYGGSGGDFLDLAVLLEEMGRALTPGPLFSTVVLGGMTVLEAGRSDQKEDLIPCVSAGDLVMTLALTEEGGASGPGGVQTRARLDGEEYVIDGIKLFVPDAHVADLMIVAVRTEDSKNPSEGITLLLVPGDTAGVTVSPHKTMSGDRLSEVGFHGVRVATSAVLGEVGRGWAVVEGALRRGAAAKGMEALGGAQAVLEMTVEYLKQRVQFGRPVATFQGVQHHCANMAIDVEGCREIAYQSAWALAQGLPGVREVSMAKAWVSDAYLRVCATAHQCHGAIGFTQEHELQLYTRRARGLEQAYGDARFHRKLLAQALKA